MSSWLLTAGRLAGVRGARGRWSAVVLAVALVAALCPAVSPPAAGAVRGSVSSSDPAASPAGGGPLVATDVRSAGLSARVRGQRVEVLSQREEDSTTWANPDGSFTTEAFGAPVRVRDAHAADGWSDVDLTLVARPDGRVAPRVHPEGLVLAGATGSGGGVLASLSGPGRRVELGWKGPLAKPALSGPRATYAGVSPGVDLVQEATRTGVEQLLVLRDRAAADAAVAAAVDGVYEVRVPVTLKGLSARPRTDGGVDFVDGGGRAVQTVAAPRMWDAAVVPGAGVPASERSVGMRFVATAGAGRGELVLGVDAGWLADPGRVFPVTIDPTTTLTASHDTWVQSNYSTAQAGSTELRVGTYDGSTVARSFMKWNASSFSKSDVTSATLSLWEFHSYSCSARSVDVRSSNLSDTSTVWSNQPSVGAVWYRPSFAKGYSSSCADGWVNIGITGLAQQWADSGVTYQGLRLSATSETDVYGWKRFNSANAASNVPKLSVTYNRYPNTPGTATHTPGTSSSSTAAPGWSRSLTPTLKAVVSDPDGGSVKGLFSVYQGTGGSPIISKAAGSSVTSGGTSQFTVPAGVLTEGMQYLVRVYAYDGSLTSKSWSNYDYFTVDTTAPAAPSVTSSTTPEGDWSDTVDADGNLAFTATSGAADTAAVQYSLDEATFGSSLPASAGAPVDFTVPKPSPGAHTLYVRALDSAGNASAARAYGFSFAAGAALAQPVDNHVTARRVALALSVDPAKVAALGAHKYQYRRGAADGWHDVPLADTTDPAGATLTGWPATAASTTVSYWDAAATLAGGGVVDVRAVTDGGDGVYAGEDLATAWRTVTVDVNAGQAGEATAGPGSVNLLTGQLSLSDTDATVFGASIGRSYGSRSLDAGTANGQAGAFGPQWALTGASEYTDADWTAVVKTSALSVDVHDTDNGVVSFTAASSAPLNTAWVPEPGAEDLTLTGSLTSSTSTFTLRDSDGNLTTFTRPASTPAPPVDTWPVASTTPAGAGAAARYGYDTDAAGKLRLARVAAPNPALSDTALQACADKATDLMAATARGCRTLELVWGDPDGDGGFTGQRVTAVKAYAWDPAAGSGAGAMTVTTEATYGYDGAGRLTSVTDPKPGLVPGGHALTTTYGYDSTNLLTTLTPPGELAWTFGYATSTIKAGPAWDQALPTYPGRLVTVSRPTLAPGTAGTVNGTATTAFVYGVATTVAAKGPVDVSQAATDTWGQVVAPVEGTAVFDPDAAAQPAGDFWAGDDTTARAWGKSTTTYMDVNGRETNHLGRDGLMDATGYNTDGNPVFELTGGNRALALGQGTDAAAKLADLGLNETASKERAQALATITRYEDGTNGAQRVAWTQGPLHTVVTATGAQDQQRATTRTSYNAGRPADAPTADLVTTSVTGGLALGADPATAALDNPRTTTTGYDWTLGQPTSVTTDPSAAAGDEITVRTAYDAKGRVTRQQQPADAAGTTAGTRVTTYWDASTGACTGHPEWGDLVCQTAYAAAITGSTSNTALPVTITTYNRAGAAASTTETANGATRTTTTTFDAADRPATLTTTSTGLGTNPAAQAMTYDPATGDLASATAGGTTISTSSDQLGRQLTYTDGTGLRSATEYDTLGRATTVTETDTATGGLARSFTVTAAYDPATGRQTSQTDSQAGTTTLGYDTAGNVTTQTFTKPAAGGLASTSRYDSTGDEVERVWTMTGLADPVLSESAVANIHGQQVDHTMMPGGHRDYAYDGTGRLTAVTDLDAGQCTTRAYRFDVNSNRTGSSSTTAAATADGSGDLTVCPSPLPPAAAASFDTGDRATAAGYGYDPFGRTTRLPLPGGQVLRVGYRANDLVATQTLYATATDADAAGGAGQNPVDTSSYTLDVTGQRIATRTAQTTDPVTGARTTLTQTLRYAGSSDAPDWTDEGDGTLTRTITGPTGDLTATATFPVTSTTDADDVLTWQLSDLHGDIATTLPANNTDVLHVSRPDEYGASTDDQPRYGWLGAKQRAGDTPGGIILMGVRLYNPVTGRFLTPDPVYGGNPNTYTYPTDPINGYDLDGRWGSRKFWRRAKWIAGAAAFGTCVFLSAGACLGAGVLAAGVAARQKVGTFKGSRFRSEWGKGAAWAAAGAGVGRGVGAVYQAAGRGVRVARVGRHVRYGRAGRAWNRLRYGVRSDHRLRGPHWSYYEAQTGAGAAFLGFSNGPWRRRR